MTTHCADIFTEEKGIQETKGSHIKKNKSILSNSFYLCLKEVDSWLEVVQAELQY